MTDPQRCGAAGQVSEPYDPPPSARWGWVMGTVWLVFLGFPVVNVLAADVARGWKVTGIAALVAFAGVYGRGLYRLDHLDDRAAAPRVAATHLAVMVLLLIPLAPMLREGFAGTLPYVVSMAIIGLPLRWGLAIWGVCIAIAVVVPLALGEPVVIFLAGILVLVGAFVLLIRHVDQRESEYYALAEERRLGQERDRVARDVHDVLGHSLTVITVKLELAERLIDLDPERAKAELADARSMTRQSLAEIRATVAGLRIARLSDEIARSRDALEAAGIAATVPDDPEVVDPRHRIVLAWSVREIVTNVVRHSRATTCAIAWGTDWLTVTDDGVGMRGRREGNGIRGVRERVQGAGGALDISAGPDGHGTEVRVQL